METLAIPGFPPLSKSKTVLSLTFSQLCQIPALTLAPGPRPFPQSTLLRLVCLVIPSLFPQLNVLFSLLFGIFEIFHN